MIKKIWAKWQSLTPIGKIAIFTIVMCLGGATCDFIYHALIGG